MVFADVGIIALGRAARSSGLELGILVDIDPGRVDKIFTWFEE